MGVAVAAEVSAAIGSAGCDAPDYRANTCIKQLVATALPPRRNVTSLGSKIETAATPVHF